jgi:hypothetical protein
MAPSSKSKEAEKEKLTRIALVSDDKVGEREYSRSSASLQEWVDTSDCN